MQGETYEEFVEKFKPKKTTDDCYTPPDIYEAIKQWACNKFDIDPDKILRPFWPGADYKKTDYPEGYTVVDNPPFSILTQICEYYLERGIPFFLFAPSLTCFTGKTTFTRMSHIICDCDIIYENGALVKTSFVTSFEPEIAARTAPDLTLAVNNVTKRLKKTKQLPKYAYPDYIVTAAMMQKYARYGVQFEVKQASCRHIRSLESQREKKKSMFGTGLLLSEKAAAEKAAAEKAAAEKAAAEKWTISEKEMEIIKTLE